MNQEYQIPSGDFSTKTQINSDTVLTDVVKTLDILPNTEKKSSISEELYQIGDAIIDARSEYVSRNFPDSKKSLMGNIIKRLLKSEQRFLGSEDDLKQYESELGASLFINSIRPDEKVRFFNDNRKSWFFYRKSNIGTKQETSTTIHYEIHDSGVLRVSDLSGAKGEFIGGQELNNFVSATRMYKDLVFSKIYNDVQFEKIS